MPRTDFDVQVAGLKELVEGLRTMQDPKAQKRIIGDSLAKTGKAVVIPALRQQMASDFKKRGVHRNKRGVTSGRGKGGPAERNVTARRSRLRNGELVAVNFGPRAWWSHFPITGTKPHVIAATGRGPFGRQAPSSVVRSINRQYTGRTNRSNGDLTRTGKALFIQGYYRERVQHPGSRGTDSIRKAVQGVVPRLNERYAADLSAAYERFISRPTRQAKPRTPGT